MMIFSLVYLQQERPRNQLLVHHMSLTIIEQFHILFIYLFIYLFVVCLFTYSPKMVDANRFANSLRALRSTVTL